MHFFKIFLLFVSVFLLNISSAKALVKIDDTSVDLAIKYGIQMKNNSLETILGTNWIQDKDGRILNIYSPFMQIAMKTKTKPSTGEIEEDLKMAKSLLTYDLTKIKNRNEIRFLVSLYGDDFNFAKNYKAFIIEKDKYSNTTPEKYKITPKKTSAQKIADRDNFHPNHPFSAVNCYVFKFDNISKLKEYYFILVSNNNDEIKYRINNEDIF